MLQLGAYYLAHTKNYGPIEQGVISMCSRDLQYQEFRLNESDLKDYGDKFLERLEQYNKIIEASSLRSSSPKVLAVSLPLLVSDFIIASSSISSNNVYVNNSSFLSKPVSSIF